MKTAWTLLLLVCCGSMWAAPPRVLSIAPKSGDSAVDPSVKELRIEFDQAMDRGGFSLCGGGPEFPKINGRGQWVSDTTVVFPIQLEAGRQYRLSINCPSARNFKNAAGESAAITPVSFKTAGRAAPAQGQAELNKAAIANLKKGINERYSYRDRVFKDWLATFAKAEKELATAADAMDFAKKAGVLLRPAQDPHLFFRVGNTVVPTLGISLKANGELDLLSKAVPQWKKINNVVYTGRFDDDIGYIAILSWTSEAADAGPAVDAMKDLRGLIIDARFNAGGDERVAQEFASRFTKNRAVFAKHRSRDLSGASGWDQVRERQIEPIADETKRFQGKVAVLMGEKCFSSNETFLLMMRHGAKAILVGERSYGASGNPQPFDLGNGVVMMIPSWQAMDANGEIFEGKGILPDIQAKFTPGARDGVLDAALDSVRKF